MSTEYDQEFMEPPISFGFEDLLESPNPFLITEDDGVVSQLPPPPLFLPTVLHNGESPSEDLGHIKSTTEEACFKTEWPSVFDWFTSLRESQTQRLEVVVRKNTKTAEISALAIPSQIPVVDVDVSTKTQAPKGSSAKTSQLPVGLQSSPTTTSIGGSSAKAADISNVRRNQTAKSIKTSPQCPQTKPFECNLCHTNFKIKKHLTRHKRLHTEDPGKPYRCELCNANFAKRNYLKLHYKRQIHLSNVEKGLNNHNK